MCYDSWWSRIRKRFTLDAIINTLSVEHNIQSHACAPTGKAASNINGFTIFSKDGLKVPVLKYGIPYKPLQGITLTKFQN